MQSRAHAAVQRSTLCRTGWEETADAAAPPARPRSLNHLPSYGIGISAGSAFLLKMPRYMKVGGALVGGRVGAGCDRCLLPGAAACSAASNAAANLASLHVSV